MSVLIGVGDFGVGDLVSQAQAAAQLAIQAAQQVGNPDAQVAWKGIITDFLNTTADRITFDGSIWEKKAGSIAPDNGVTIAGSPGFYYHRQYDGQLKLSFYKYLVVNGDWKPAFDAAMTFLNTQTIAQKGGEIWLDNYIYETSTITMQSRITFVSAGRGVGIIRLKSGTNGDCIVVPNTAWLCGLRNITIDGNKAGNTAGSGLYIVGALDTDGHSQDQVWDKNITGSSSYTYFKAENLTVTHCAGSGIVIPGTGGVGGNYICYFHDVITEWNNGYGFFNRSTDNMFSAIVAEKNGRTGIYEAGANNKWTKLKSIWNGQDPAYQYDSAGIRVIGQRNMFTQAETQDNYYHGFWIQGTDNMFVNCLADGNGYISPAETLSNRKTFGYFINGAVAPVFTNCKASNYRGLQSANGLYTQERGYYIDSTSRNVRGFIDANPKHNSPSVNESMPTRNSPLMFCFRATSITLNSVTFAPGQPVITDQGLTVSAADQILIPEPQDVRGSFTASIDFTPTTLAGTVTRLLDSDSLNIAITYVNDGSSGAPRLDFATKISGLRKAVAINNYPLVMGRSYRISVKARILETTLWMYALVSYQDSKGIAQQVTQQAIATVAVGDVFDPVSNLMVNWAGDKVAGVYKNILLSTEVLSDGELTLGTDFSGRIIASALFANFQRYRLPTGLFVTPTTSLPQASAYYRGIQIFQRSGSFQDYVWRCVKRPDGTYTWKNESLVNGYTNSGKPTAGSWDQGTVLWNGAPSVVTAPNGAGQLLAGWQNVGGGFAGFQPMMIPIGDQNLIGTGPAYPTTAQIGSAGKYLFWRTLATGIDQISIWYSKGSGVLRAITPIGGKVIITGNGLQTIFTIPHTLPYIPDFIQLSGIPHKNIVVDATLITFTLTEVLSNGNTVAVYWSAK